MTMSEYLVPPVSEDTIPNPFQCVIPGRMALDGNITRCAVQAFSILLPHLVWRIVLLNLLFFIIYSFRVMFKDVFCVWALVLNRKCVL